MEKKYFKRMVENRAKFINEHSEFNYLYESYCINEKLDLSKIKSKGKRAAMISGVLIALFLNKFSKDEMPEKDEIMSHPAVMKLSKKDDVNKQDINAAFKSIFRDLSDYVYRDPLELSISDKAVEMIKKHEKLMLNAYTIGDRIGGERAITIGYGHANPESRSKYQLGDKITKEEAERLLKKDLQRKEEGVKRIFRQWKEQGIDRKITQGMYDAMVSMAFNMGIGGLRRSEFIQELKKGNYKKAADLITSTRVSDRFSGLIKRRHDERDMFLRDIT